jgi:hypothetical protein
METGRSIMRTGGASTPPRSQGTPVAVGDPERTSYLPIFLLPATPSLPLPSSLNPSTIVQRSFPIRGRQRLTKLP